MRVSCDEGPASHIDLESCVTRHREVRHEALIEAQAGQLLSVSGFQHEAQAREFLSALRERLKAFALSLHPQKTRMIQFGRFAARYRKCAGKA